MTKKEITFDNLPKDVLDTQIEVLMAANPTMKLTRVDCVECIKKWYVIKTIETDSFTHYILDPKESV